MLTVVLFYCCDICYYHYLRTDAVYTTFVWCTSRIVITLQFGLPKYFIHNKQTYLQSISVPNFTRLAPMVRYHSYVSESQFFQTAAMLLHFIRQKYYFNKRWNFSKTCYDKQPDVETARSTARVWGRSVAGTGGWNPAGCLSLVSVVFGRVVVSALAWSLVQSSLTECILSKWVWSWNLNKEEVYAKEGRLAIKKKYDK